jgi:acetamidase/formamidase
VDGGSVYFDDQTTLPIRPLIGCLAVAPEAGELHAKLQGRYGGNMDCREIRAGATVLLPVSHGGGGLYFDDCKALMGDGEIVGSPEVGALVTASAEPRKRPAAMTWPRIETPESMTTLVSGKSLEWSARQAYRELLDWVVDDYEIDRRKAALLMAMVAQAGICQISNTDYTAYCVTPREIWEPYLSCA